MIERGLIGEVEASPCDGKLYLISKLSDLSGFFAENHKLAYIVRNFDHLPSESIETEYLSLKTNISIRSIENAPSFPAGLYNIIIFKREMSDINAPYFVKLCMIHSDNVLELNFKEFFYSLISLFQLPVEQSFKNAIGLYGELKFMQYMWKYNGKDLSSDWHRDGSNSLFDFAGKTNYEVKTVLSEGLLVRIKHSQIFNSHNCVLVVINCEKYDNGETIFDVVDWLAKQGGGFCSLDFNIKIQKEVKRISISESEVLHLSAMKGIMFDSQILNPFNKIPDEISDLTYIYDLSEKEYLDKFIFT